MATGNPDVADILLKTGTPVDVLDDDGATPLALLVARLENDEVRHGYPAIVRMLLTAGANPDLRYPRNLSVKSRLLRMDKWRPLYEPILEQYLMRSPRLD
jgi:ankyrin repeat protein